MSLFSSINMGIMGGNYLSIHFQGVEEMNQLHRSKMRRYESLGFSPQPGLFAVRCPESSSGRTYYVLYQDISYSFNSVIEAIDGIFCLFQVFRLDYPFDSGNCWSFIQRTLFKFFTDYDKLCPAIALLEHGLNLAVADRAKPSHIKFDDSNVIEQDIDMSLLQN